jgi:hypothetical protein
MHSNECSKYMCVVCNGTKQQNSLQLVHTYKCATEGNYFQYIQRIHVYLEHALVKF